MLLQLWKTLVPRAFTSSRLLHRLIHRGLRTFVTPEANHLILRHFHIGSELLAFVARNAPVAVPTSPLRPQRLSDLERDEVFLNHDLNLFNFVIRLNQALRAEGRELLAPDTVDFQDITDGPFPIEPLPSGWLNVVDVQTAIEVYTPLYQLFLSDSDFWRATNSLQLDETIGIYAARILRSPEHLVLLNNKHPLVPLVTHGAGLRLMLHGLSAEALHALLRQGKRRAAATAPSCP
jgi:hypothetical protein